MNKTTKKIVTNQVKITMKTIFVLVDGFVVYFVIKTRKPFWTNEKCTLRR